MTSAPRSSRPIRFGVFEADLDLRELRKSGIKLKLHDQPFQILAALLERPGEIVTREEMRQRLWPTETFVDFDHSINTAMNRLREVLGDSADSPRFIETVARRGYRFVAPVYSTTETAALESVPAPKAAPVEHEGPASRVRQYLPWLLIRHNGDGLGCACRRSFPAAEARATTHPF